MPAKRRIHQSFIYPQLSSRPALTVSRLSGEKAPGQPYAGKANSARISSTANHLSIRKSDHAGKAAEFRLQLSVLRATGRAPT
jgi:hypothetical protein